MVGLARHKITWKGYLNADKKYTPINYAGLSILHAPSIVQTHLGK